MSLYFMIFTVGQILKLFSFHHVMYDNRVLLRRIQTANKDKNLSIQELSHLFNVNEQELACALDYPKNLKFSHYVRFLCAPTCCFQFNYPTTNRIRVRFVLKRIFELLIGNSLAFYLLYQHMFPTADKANESIRNKNYQEILLRCTEMAIPAAYFWLALFYCVFHSYLNLFAELTRFADRRFYADWWNANDLAEYWRKWNLPIHNWLIRHAYYPLRRRKFSSTNCLLITFFLSAVFHEYIMAGILSSVNFIAFTIMMANVPLIAL